MPPKPKRNEPPAPLLAAIIAGIALAAAGCTSLDEALARPIPYQKYQGTGSGYASTEIQPNIFRVSFVADPKADPHRVADFALLQAADLALDHHFGSFVVVHQSARAQGVGFAPAEIGMQPDFAQNPTIGTAPMTGVRPDNGAPEAPAPQPTANVTTLVIECSAISHPADPAYSTYDARQIARELRAKYALAG